MIWKIFLSSFLAVFCANALDAVDLEYAKKIAAEKLAEEKKLNPINKKLIAKSQSWVILSAKPNDVKMCYAILYPKKRIGNLVMQDDKPYLQINYFSPYKQRLVIFFDYKVRSSLHASIAIDGKQFELKQSMQQYAIATTKESENEVISQMKKSNT